MDEQILRSTIAERLQVMRDLAGLSPEEITAKTGNKISPSYIRRLEKGENSPTVEAVAFICAACRTTLAKFFSSFPAELFELPELAGERKRRA
jgi:transcriptional regulator with XRE-family HTH domain